MDSTSELGELNIDSGTQKLDPSNNFTSQSALSIPQSIKDEYNLNYIPPPQDPEDPNIWYDDQVDGGRNFENEYLPKMTPIGASEAQIKELNEFNQKAFNTYIGRAYQEEVYQPYVDSFKTYESNMVDYNSNLMKLYSEMDRSTVSTFPDNALDFTNAELLDKTAPILSYNPNSGLRGVAERYSIKIEDFLGDMTLEEFDKLMKEKVEEYIDSEEGKKIYDEAKEELRLLPPPTTTITPDGPETFDINKEQRRSLESIIEANELFKEGKLVSPEDREKIYDLQGPLERKKYIEKNAKEFLVLTKEQYNDFLKSSNLMTDSIEEEVSDEEYAEYLRKVEDQIFLKTATDDNMKNLSAKLFGEDDGLPGFKLNLDEDLELNRKGRWEDAMGSLEIGGLSIVSGYNYLGTSIANFMTDNPLLTQFIGDALPGGGAFGTLARNLTKGRDIEQANIDALKFGEDIRRKQNEIRLDMTQMARTDKQLRTFGVSAVADGPSYSDRELAVYNKALNDAVFHFEQLPALESMPLSVSSMLVGTLASGGNPAAGAAITASLMSTHSGATYYYETLLADEYQLGPQRFGHLSRGDKMWYAWKHGAWEWGGEFLGNYIMMRGLGMGKGLPGMPGAFNKEMAGNVGGVVESVGTRSFTQRSMQHVTGIGMASGIGFVEESAAEYITGFGQSLNTQAAQMVDGNRVFEFRLDYDLANEEGMKGARTGRWMGLGMGGGAATLQRSYAELQLALDFTDRGGTYDQKSKLTAASQLLKSEGFGGGLGAAKWGKIQDLVQELGDANLLQVGTAPTTKQAEILKEINNLMQGINAEGYTQEAIIEQFMKGNSGLAAIAIIQDNLNQHDFYANIKRDEQGKYRDTKGRFVSVNENSLWIDYAENLTAAQKADALKRHKARTIQLDVLKTMADLSMFRVDPAEARDIEYYRNHSSDYNSDWRNNRDGDFTDISLNEDGSLNISAELQEVMGEDNINKLKGLLEADESGNLKITIHNTFSSLEGVTGKGGSEGYYIGRKDGTQEVHVLAGEDMTQDDISRVLVHEYGHYAFEKILSENPELVKSLYEEIIDMGAKNPKIQKIVNATSGQGEKELINSFMEAIATGKFVRKDADGNIVMDEFGFSLFGASGGFWEMLKAAGVKANIPGLNVLDFSKEDSAIVLAAKYSMLINSPKKGQVAEPDVVEETTDETAEEGLESRRGMKLEGEPLSSRYTIDDIMTMRELDNMENFEVIFFKEGRDAISRARSRTFKNKWKFVDFWRQSTNDGSLNHMYTDWTVDGKPLDVNYTNRSLSTWKFKKPFISYRQWDEQRTLELREQRVELSKERGEMWRNNDLNLNFYFNYSAFEPDNADGAYREDGSKREESLIENDEIAIANMKALLDSDVTEDDLKAIKGSATKIYDDKAKPLSQRTGLSKKATFENEAARLNEETAEMGMAWQFLPHDSFGYEKRINDFRHASMEELEAAAYKLEAINKGVDQLEGDPLIFSSSQIEGLLSGRINSNATNNRQKDLDLSEDLKDAFTEIAYRFGDFRREDPIDNEILEDWIGKNVIYTLLPYDPSGPQKVELEHISYLKDEDGDEIPVPHKIEFSFGDGTTANQRYNKANPKFKQISSHSKNSIASKVRGAAMQNPGKVHVILYRRASDLNVFNSPSPFSAVMEYLLDVAKNNTGEKNEEGLTIGEKYITTQLINAFNETFDFYKKNESFTWQKFQTTIENSVKFSTNADLASLKIENNQGLIEILEALADPTVSNKLGFEGDPRQNLIKDVFGQGKTIAGVTLPKTILDRNSLKNKFLDPGLKGTEKGDIVSLSAYKIPEEAGSLTLNQPTDEYAKSIGFNKRSNLGASALNQGYKYGFQLRSGDVFYTSLKTTADSRMIGKTGYADYAGKGERFRGLLSSRLPGRMYTQGNSEWEKSEATAYGAIAQMLATKFADKFTPVFLLQQDIQEFKNSKVAESEDFMMAMDRMYGMVRTDLEALESRIELIQFTMEEAGLEAEQVSDYLYAKHAEERNDFINKLRPELLDGSGMTNDDAAEILEELASPQMEAVAKLVYEVLENTRESMVEGGLERRERIEAWENQYDHYVPLSGRAYDEMEDSEQYYPTGGAGMAIYGATTKAAKGRPSKTGVNLISNVIMQNAMVQQRARKDQAMLSLYNLVKNNPNEGVWNTFSAESPKYHVDREGNTTPMNEFEMRANRHMVPIRINGDQHFIYFKKTEYADVLNGMTQQKVDGVLAMMSGPMSLMRNAFTQYNPAFFIGNFFRDINGAVYNVISELERSDGIISGYNINTKDFTKALVAQSFSTLKILLNEAAFDKEMTPEMRELVREWEAAGGRTGFSYSENLNSYIENLKKGVETKTGVKEKIKGTYAWDKSADFFNYVAGINEAFENSIRLAAYIEARKAGVSIGKSAQLSKNITVNFNKSGEWGASLNQVFLFFNASVQGLTRFGRTFALNQAELPDNPDEKKSWRNRISKPQKLAAGAALLSSMQTLINIALSGRDDDDELYYNKIADYKKERGFVIMTGEKDYITIPLGYGYNLFNNFGTMLAEVAAGQRHFDDASMFMALSAHSSFSPIAMGHSGTLTEEVIKGATPTAIKPWMDAFAWNQTYFGGIVKRKQYPWGAEVPESTLSFRSPYWLKDASIALQEMTRPGHRITGGIDVNPDPYYYIGQSYWGGAGDFITESAGLARAGLAATARKISILSESRNDDEFIDNLISAKDSDLPTIKISDVPILKTIYGGPSRFYDFDLFEKNKQEILELDEVITRGRYGTPSDPNMRGVQQLADELRQTEEMLDLIRQAKKQVRELPYIERTNSAYELQEAERKEVMRFNAKYYELRGQYIDPKPQGIIPINAIRKAIGTDE